MVATRLRRPSNAEIHRARAIIIMAASYLPPLLPLSSRRAFPIRGQGQQLLHCRQEGLPSVTWCSPYVKEAQWKGVFTLQYMDYMLICTALNPHLMTHSDDGT